jgi:hypothetical protein
MPSNPLIGFRVRQIDQKVGQQIFYMRSVIYFSKLNMNGK